MFSYLQNIWGHRQFKPRLWLHKYSLYQHIPSHYYRLVAFPNLAAYEPSFIISDFSSKYMYLWLEPDYPASWQLTIRNLTHYNNYFASDELNQQQAVFGLNSTLEFNYANMVRINETVRLEFELSLMYAHVKLKNGTQDYRGLNTFRMIRHPLRMTERLLSEGFLHFNKYDQVNIVTDLQLQFEEPGQGTLIKNMTPSLYPINLFSFRVEPIEVSLLVFN